MALALATVERWNLGLSAGAVAASWALMTPHFATSVAAGAFIEAINLGAIHRAARRLFAGELMTAGWVGGLAMRFVLLGAAIFVPLISRAALQRSQAGHPSRNPNTGPVMSIPGPLNLAGR